MPWLIAKITRSPPTAHAGPPAGHERRPCLAIAETAPMLQKFYEWTSSEDWSVTGTDREDTAANQKRPSTDVTHINKTNRMTEPIADTKQFEAEIAALRRTISGLTQENTRLRIAFADALAVLNSARTRLEIARIPSLYPTWEEVEPSLDKTLAGTTARTPSTNDLHVVEELPFRDQMIRLLSDGTIEAKTPDGVLRFEDAEHLEEVFNGRWPEAN